MQGDGHDSSQNLSEEYRGVMLSLMLFDVRYVQCIFSTEGRDLRNRVRGAPK